MPLIIEIKLTKHQKKKLEPFLKIINKMYEAGEPGAIVAQFHPELGTCRCGLYNHQQMAVFIKHFSDLE